HAIGLEGNTPGTQVKNNSISNLTSSNNDAVGVKLEDNPGAGTVAIEENSFRGVNYAIATATAPQSATCNYYGTTDPLVVAALISGPVNFLPFDNNGTDDDSSILGYQPESGACSGTGPVEVYDTNSNLVASYMTIQAAIDAPSTLAGYVVRVDAGTYPEDVLVNKQLSILGAGIGVSTVSGPIGGSTSTFQIASTNVLIDGFSITRAGNNPTDWNLALNLAGIAIQGMASQAEVRNCELVGNRNAFDINNSNGNNIHNNYIHFNRTGMIFRNQTDNTTVENNIIRDNWTVGVLFLDASGGSNVPVQSAAGSSFSNNDISGNWYGQIVDRQNGGSLPAPGANLKNFTCNWYGATSPVTSVANSAEPGYSAQIPVAYGGLAVAPGGQPDILGTASANFTYSPWRTDGTDAGSNDSDGFQPVGTCNGTPVVATLGATTTASCSSTADGSISISVSGGTAPYSFAWTGPSAIGDVEDPTNILPGSYDVVVMDANSSTDTIAAIVVGITPYSGPTWYVSTTGSDSNTGTAGCPFATIQFAVNAASNGHSVNVAAGSYYENVLVDKSLDIGGAVGTVVYPAMVGNVCSPGSLCSGASNVFLVRANNVTIHNLTVDGDNTGIGSGIDARNGIIVDHNSGTFTNLEVHDVTVQNIWLRGIMQGSGGTFNFHDNTVSNVQSDPASIGIFGFGGHGSIQNNTVSGCNDAIASNQGIGGNLEISGNTVTNSGSGVHVDNWNGGGTVTIHDNTVSSGMAYAYGIWAFASYAPITIADNTISGQYVGLMHAGTRAPAGVVTFSGNEVSNCDYGLYQTTTLFGYGDVNVESVAMNNSIAGGGTAYELESTASGVTRTFTAHENSATGYTTATHVTVNGPATDDMTCNWWDTGDALAVDAAVDDGIVFLPFDNSGVDDAPATKGYQPESGACSGTGPVEVYDTNSNLVASYMTIQAAIDDATTLNGYEIHVAAGTYAENVNVNKGVTLRGANANTACGSRGTESIIAPATGLPVNVAADGVTINGFEITAPSNRNGIQGGTWNNLSVLFNNIHHINSSASPMLMDTHAVEYTVSSGGGSNVTVSDNCIHDIGSANLTGKSASAIGVLGSNSLGTLNGLHIERNSIDDVTVNNATWPTGKIAYGVMINTGGNGSYMTNGKVTGAQVNDNEIDGLSGHITTGLALEGNTENAVVTGNIVSHLSSTKNADLANGGYEANALKFESNRYVSTCTVEDNAFLVGTFSTAGGSGTGYGVANYVPTANGGTADVGCNWFDTASYDVIAQNGINGRVLDKAGCATDFTAWRTDGTDGNSAIGFQPSGPCNGTPVVATLGTATPVACNGGSDGAILVDISGGTYEDISPADGADDDGDVTYSWTGVSPVSPEFATTQDVSGLSAGTYRLVVTDGNGSTDTLDVVITEPALLSASVTISPSTICYNTNTTATFTGPVDGTVTYTVNNGAPTTILLDNAGTATLPLANVIVNTTIDLVSVSTNSPACSNAVTGSAGVVVDPLPVATITPTDSTICENGSFTFSGGDASTANGTYAWSHNGAGSL
ncbi:MAG: right-handed parallel beta-helix repeat-containing protein, partial [Acidobacteria bacterium]|nr:right-handed parallel beta-helix repeat-containing protein [Acidobacteriota bacterium]